MSCGGGHLGFPIGIKSDGNSSPGALVPDWHKKQKTVEDLPMIIPGQFGFN
jgi:hypothetical protein